MPVIDPQADLIRLASIKAATESLAAEKAVIETRLVGALHARGAADLSTTVDGETIKGTLVEAVRVIISEDKLKKALTAAQWKKVVTEVLDKEKLEAAVAMKIVDMNVVAAASEEKHNKPYIKVSGKVGAMHLPNVTLDGGVVTVDVPPTKRRRAVKAVKPVSGP